jgi:CDP-glucose 4,6-dehydratase
MTLAEKLCGDSSYSGAYNFGPEPEGAASVSLVISKARDSYGNCEVQFMQDDSAGLYEARYLALQNLKAKEFLGVKPRWDLHDAILQTIGWYKLHSNGECARELCFQNIDHYEGVN